MTGKAFKDIGCKDILSFYILTCKSQNNVYILFECQLIVLLIYLHCKGHIISDSSTLSTDFGHQIPGFSDRDNRLGVITACHCKDKQANW